MEPNNNTEWRDKVIDSSNFDQKVPYSYEKLIQNLEEANADLEHLKPYQFLSAVYEFTKAFNLLSSALSMGFSDITEKVDLWRELFQLKIFEDCNDMQSVMEKEIELKIHILNGDNNSDQGHKKKTPYYKYVSGTRTMLRLSWFLHFMMKTLRYMNETDFAFNKCIKKSYEDVLAPHHPWLVRQGASIALGFAPKKRDPVVNVFFGKFNFYI
jgi:hypothetical protein